MLKDTKNGSTQVLDALGGLYHFNQQTAVLPEPRLSVTRAMSDSLSFKGFLGRFGQAPSMEMTAEGVGNPTLGLMRAWQLSVGAERVAAMAARMQAEGARGQSRITVRDGLRGAQHHRRVSRGGLTNRMERGYPV